MSSGCRIAIIGAGPIGLEAALTAVQCGHSVAVYEQGEVGAHVRQWGHVRMFSPFGMNSSARGRAALRERGHQLPPDDALLTGSELVQRYLEPLSRLPPIACALQQRCTVHGVSRQGTLKHELIGDPRRAQRPFVLSIGGADERFVEADAVLDCSGTFGRPNACGPGGLWPLGNGGAETGLPDVLGAARPRYAGRHVVVIGAGYSAATNVVLLAQLANDEPATRVTWLTRRLADVPMLRIPNDALPERDQLAARANALVGGPVPPVNWRPGTTVQSVQYWSSRRRFVVAFLEAGAARLQVLECDRVLANCGYRPDRALYEELHLHECYATQGPMKLAARLLGETSSDCLAQVSHGADALRNPEPRFYILGAKSYGRNSHFLLQVGLQQVEAVIRALSDE